MTVPIYTQKQHLTLEQQQDLTQNPPKNFNQSLAQSLDQSQAIRHGVSSLDNLSDTELTMVQPTTNAPYVVHPRSIRTYVLRAGRMTDRQQRGINQGWPEFGLQSNHGLLDLTQTFKREALTTLEIGFGMGGTLLELAKGNPDVNFIGIEVHPPGVGALLADIIENRLTNVRIFQEDALSVLQNAIPKDSLNQVLLYFPDPWHKSRHHKRRMVQSAWAELIRQRLKMHGHVHLATDWEAYAEHMKDTLNAADGFKNQDLQQGYIPRPPERPVTKFEQRGQRLGHGVWDLKFQRIA